MMKKNGKYTIYDWKRSDKTIFNGMPVMPSKYRQNPVLRLGIFHPSYHKPYVLRVPYMKNGAETLMSLRESVIL